MDLRIINNPQTKIAILQEMLCFFVKIIEDFIVLYSVQQDWMKWVLELVA